MIDLVLEIALGVFAFAMLQAWRLERSRREALEREQIRLGRALGKAKKATDRLGGDS